PTHPTEQASIRLGGPSVALYHTRRGASGQVVECSRVSHCSPDPRSTAEVDCAAVGPPLATPFRTRPGAGGSTAGSFSSYSLSLTLPARRPAPARARLARPPDRRAGAERCSRRRTWSPPGSRHIR